MPHNPLLRTTASPPFVLDETLTAETLRSEPVAGVPGAFLLGPLLTREECEQLIETTESLGYAAKKSRRSGPAIRTNERLLYQPPQTVIDLLAQRLRPHLASIETRSVGEWRLSSGSSFLNDRWRLNRYREGEVFHPHFDTGYERGPDCRSLLSLIVYLNDDFGGGETVFFPDGQTRDHMLPGDLDATEVALRPEAGMALLFHHYGPLNPRHSGRSPHAGRPKYIIRSDIFYERTPLPLDALLFGRQSDGHQPSVRRCILLMGPPGVGKSTQLRKVSAALDWTGIDFGHAVRTTLATDSVLARDIRVYRQQRNLLQDQTFGGDATQRRPGGWLSDGLSRAVIEAQLEALSPPGTPSRGLVLDGFPRMRSQSLLLEGSAWQLLAVIHLTVAEELRQARLQTRGLDPVTGEPVSLANSSLATNQTPSGAPVRRPEDSPTSIAARQTDYERDTLPLLEHYRKRGVVLDIDGAQPEAQVTASILAQLSRCLLKEATHRFPSDLQALLTHGICDGQNHSKRPDSLVFRFEFPERPALYLKLAPAWGAHLEAEARFLGSGIASTWGLLVPACVGCWTLDDGVTCLVTQALPGRSAKQVAQSLTSDAEKQRLVTGLAEALRRIHGSQPPPPELFPVARLETAALLERASTRFAQGQVPLRNFSARYGKELSTESALAQELARLHDLLPQFETGDRVPIHGDACLPNFCVDESGAITGCLDLSGAGLADPTLDLALAHWSIAHNLGESWAEAFRQAYSPNVERTRLLFFSDLRRFLV